MKIRFKKELSRFTKGDEDKILYAWNFFKKFDIIIAIVMGYLACSPLAILFAIFWDGDLNPILVFSTLPGVVCLSPLVPKGGDVVTDADTLFADTKEHLITLVLSVVAAIAMIGFLIFFLFSSSPIWFSIVLLPFMVYFACFVYKNVKFYVSWWCKLGAQEFPDTLTSRRFRYRTADVDMLTHSMDIKSYVKKYKTISISLIIAGPTLACLTGMAYHPLKHSTKKAETHVEKIVDSQKVTENYYQKKIDDFVSNVYSNGNYQLLLNRQGKVYYCKSGLSISDKYNKPFLLPIIVWDARDNSKLNLNIPNEISGHIINANMIVDKLDFEGLIILIVSSDNGENLDRLKIVSFNPSNESFAYVGGNGNWSFGKEDGVDYVAYSVKVRKKLSQGEFYDEYKQHRISISQLLDQASNNKPLELDYNSTIIEDVIDTTDNHRIIEEMLPKLRENYLTTSDLSGYTQEQLMLMRNAIFAVHGYRFNGEYFQNFFSKFEWYSPQYDNVSSQLSEIERQNIDTILSIE